MTFSNVNIDQDGVGGTDFSAAVDSIASNNYQRIKLVDGSEGSTDEIPGDSTGGLWVNVKALDSTVRFRLWDGTTEATVRNLAANDALNVAIVDGSGNQVTSFAGSGGTSSTDDADFTQSSTAGTPMMGVYESAATSVTDNDMGVVGMNVNRALKVSLTESTLDVAHDAADSGSPVLVGTRAQNVLPTAVANADRARMFSDLFGRLMVGHIPPETQIWKSAAYTTTQTGAVIWDPTAGKRIAVTYLEIGSYATTAGRLILWFGANGDSSYTAGSDQPLFIGKFSPSSTVTPGAVVPLSQPVFCQTADHELHATTDAGLSVDIVVYGYEW